MWGLSHMSQHLSESQALYSGWNSWYFLGCKDLKDTDHLAEYSTQNKGQWMSTDPRKGQVGALDLLEPSSREHIQEALIQGEDWWALAWSQEVGSSQSCLTIPMAKHQGSQDQVRGQVTGKGVSVLRINRVEMSLLWKSAPWYQKSSWHDDYFIQNMTILIYERENQESQVSDSLFWGSLIPGELRCNRKACDLLLYIRSWIL